MLFKSNKTAAQISLLSAVSFGASSGLAGEARPAAHGTEWGQLLRSVERLAEQGSGTHTDFLDGLLFNVPLPGLHSLRQVTEVPLPGRHSGFVVTPEIRQRVDYWFEVLTASRDVTFLSHKEYPWIEFSKIDFSALRDSLPDKQFYSRRQQRLTERRGQIQAALKQLGSGAAPRTPLEQRIHEQMSSLPGGAEKYRRVAQSSDLIWVQPGIRERMEAGLRASGLYFSVFDEILVGNFGLPRELFAVALLESSLDPRAHSRAGAAGPWQFTPDTGRDYRLKFSEGPLREPRDYDERRDFILATEAAARKLSEAYLRFGNWPLAVTSYHKGLEGTARTVKKAGSSTYTEVLPLLPFYSKNYFSEVLAALELIERRAELFPSLIPAAPLEFVAYPLSKSLSARAVLEKLEVSRDTLEVLNPALGRVFWEGEKPIPAGYNLRVPPEADLTLLAVLESQERRSVVVKKGQTLSGIARITGVSVRELQAANGLSGTRINAGQRLFLE